MPTVDEQLNQKILTLWDSDKRWAFDEDGNTLLHLLAKSGHEDSLTKLYQLQQESPPCFKEFLDKKNNNGIFPLFLAVKNGHFDFADALLDLRADITQCSARGASLLHALAETGNIDYWKSLQYRYPKKLSALLQKKWGRYTSPLHLAVRNGHKAYFDVLRAASLDPLALDTKHCNIFLIAVKKNHCDLVREILSIDNIDLTLSDYNGKTALHLAAAVPNIELMQLLLSLPSVAALKEQRDYFGRIPLDVAIENANDDAITLLGGCLETAKQHRHYGSPQVKIRQRVIIHDKLTTYLKLNQRDITQTLPDQGGYCSGFTALARYYDARGCPDEFFALLHVISQWDGKPQSLTDTEQVKKLQDPYQTLAEVFEQFINDIAIFQGESIILRDALPPARLHFGVRSESDSADTRLVLANFWDTYNFIKPRANCAPKFSLFFSETVRTLSRAELIEYIDIISKINAHIQIAFTGSQHATFLTFLKSPSTKSRLFNLYDPNEKHRFSLFVSPEQAVTCLQRYQFRCLGQPDDPMALDFVVYTLNDTDTHGAYFSSEQLPKSAEQYAQFQRQSANSFTPLHVAILADSPDNVSALAREPFVDIHAKNKAGESPIDWAFKYHRYACLLAMVDSVSNENVCFILGKIIQRNEIDLAHAILEKRKMPIAFLLKHQFSLSRFGSLEFDVEKNTHVIPDNPRLLRVAVKNEDVENVRFLIDQGADVVQRDKNNRTLFHTMLHKWLSFTIGFSDAKKREAILIMLITAMSLDEFNTKDNTDETPLATACKLRKWTVIVEKLLERGANANVHIYDYDDQKKRPLLFMLIREKLWACAKLALQQPQLNTTFTINGFTALHYLIFFFDPNNDDCHTCFNLLLTHFDINEKTAKGNTLLDVAILNNKRDAALFLLRNGAKSSASMRMKARLLEWKRGHKNSALIAAVSDCIFSHTVSENPSATVTSSTCQTPVCQN